MKQIDIYDRLEFSSEKIYQNVVDFIEIVLNSRELMILFNNLEKIPENLRYNYLAQIKAKMLKNNEPDRIIDIVELINKREIYSAINLVIKDVYAPGMQTKKISRVKTPGIHDHIAT